MTDFKPLLTAVLDSVLTFYKDVADLVVEYCVCKVVRGGRYDATTTDLFYQTRNWLHVTALETKWINGQWAAKVRWDKAMFERSIADSWMAIDRMLPMGEAHVEFIGEWEEGELCTCETGDTCATCRKAWRAKKLTAPSVNTSD